MEGDIADEAIPDVRGFTSDDAPLASVVFRTTGVPLRNNDEFTRYSSTLISNTEMRGEKKERHHIIGYQIGRRRDTTLVPYTVEDENISSMDQRIQLSEAWTHELQTAVTKEMNVSPSFRCADLSGVVYRLSAALATYTLTGDITRQDLAGGQELRVSALRTMTEAMPVVGTVFVPRNANLLDSPAAFSALVYAINGAGSAVVTDRVQVDANNAVMIPHYNGHSLAMGILTALRILFSMYKSAGAGCIAGLAYTIGIHSVGSVVSASDEGGYMRDVLRMCQYGRPYGGIYAEALRGYTHFPVFSKGDMAAAQTLVDGSLLKTAGLTALCDPLTDISGRKYPTLFATGDIAPEGAITAPYEGDDADLRSQSIRSEIASTCRRFCDRYVTGLGEMVVGDTGGQAVASDALTHMFNMAASSAGNRHTCFDVVAPYYWIEPTSLFQKKDSGPATREGHGLMCGTFERSESDAYPKARITVNDSSELGVAFEYRSVRTTPGLVHMYLTRGDGLAHVSPYQFRSERMALVGGGHVGADAPGGNVAETRAMGRSFASYFWRHGFTMLPSPAEALYLGAEIGAKFELRTGSWLQSRETDVVLPTTDSGVNTVVYTTRPPSSAGVGGIRDHGTNVRRARNRAVMSLEACNRLPSLGPSARAVDLTIQDDEPGSFGMSLPDDNYRLAVQVLGGDVGRLEIGDSHRGPARGPIYHDDRQRFRPNASGSAGSSGGGQGMAGKTVGAGARPAPPAAAAGGEVKRAGDAGTRGPRMTPAQFDAAQKRASVDAGSKTSLGEGDTVARDMKAESYASGTTRGQAPKLAPEPHRGGGTGLEGTPPDPS